MILKPRLLRFSARLALFGMAVSILSGLAATTVKAEAAGKAPLSHEAHMAEGTMAGNAGKSDPSNSDPSHAHEKCPDCCVLSFMPGCAVLPSISLPPLLATGASNSSETSSAPPHRPLKWHAGPRAPPVFIL